LDELTEIDEVQLDQLQAVDTQQRRSDVEILGRLTLSVEGVIGVESSVTFRFDDRHVAPPREQRFEGG